MPAILLVQDLQGNSPKIRLDATSANTSARFRFNLDNEIQLHGNLEIAGNGTQDFFINGAVKDYWQPRKVTKTGASKVTLTGNNTFGGDFAVLGGQVVVSGANAAIVGANRVGVGNSVAGVDPDATLTITSGGKVSALGMATVNATGLVNIVGAGSNLRAGDGLVVNPGGVITASQGGLLELAGNVTVDGGSIDTTGGTLALLSIGDD